MFTTVPKLIHSNRIDFDHPLGNQFHEMNERLCDGKCTLDDWRFLCNNCSRSSMSSSVWAQCGFDSNDTTHLYTTNKQVEARNRQVIQQLETPLAKIIAANSCTDAKCASSDQTMGIYNGIYICVGAKVLLTSNLCQPFGLVNRSAGIVKDIIYSPRTGPSTHLPLFIVVDFGHEYSGPRLFPNIDGLPPRDRWACVYPVTASWQHFNKNGAGIVSYSRVMFPLQLSWAWTVWKSQGQTIHGPILCDISDKEEEHGIHLCRYHSCKKHCSIFSPNGLTA